MIAYSTSPWPFSFGANNMVLFPFELIFVPEDRPQNYPQYIHFAEKFKALRGFSIYKIVSLSLL